MVPNLVPNTPKPDKGGETMNTGTRKKVEKIPIPPEIRKKIYRILWPEVERIHRQKMKAKEAVGSSYQGGD